MADKTTKIDLHIYLSEPVWARLQKSSERNFRSLTKEAEKLLVQALDAEDRAISNA